MGLTVFCLDCFLKMLAAAEQLFIALDSFLTMLTPVKHESHECVYFCWSLTAVKQLQWA
jgi:hypothetical protein